MKVETNQGRINKPGVIPIIRFCLYIQMLLIVELLKNFDTLNCEEKLANYNFSNCIPNIV